MRWLIPVFFLLLVSSLFAETVELSIGFSPDDFIIHNGKILLSDGEIIDFPGAPTLPQKLVNALIPPGMDVSSVELRNPVFLPLYSGELVPVPHPEILSLPIMHSLSRDESFWGDFFFPQETVLLSASGNLAGYRIASLVIYPVRYNAIASEAVYLSQATVVLNLVPREKLDAFPSRSELASHAVFSIVSKTVANPQDIECFYPRATLDFGRYDYLIITTDEYSSSADSLLSWRRQLGYTDTLVTVEEITSSFPGVDVQEKIRNFIRYAYENWGTEWALLLGDDSDIPSRVMWAMDCEADFHPRENEIHADLYYSALDGSFDANGNGIYGELSDSVDMFPDVFVGRISPRNAANARNILDKIIRYERVEDTDYLGRALFLGMVLWDDPYTDAGVGKDKIRELYLPDSIELTRLYQSLGNENYSSVLAALNYGYGIVNHDGHAWFSALGVGGSDGEDYLFCEDMDGLYNYGKTEVMYSIGCWAGAFDFDCVAEHYIANDYAGGVAFIGNDRYGWGSPGNPGWGYSERYDDRFFENIFQNRILHLAENLSEMKAHFAGYANSENVWRWHQYQINLLGDPLTAVFPGIPDELFIESPDTIFASMEMGIILRPRVVDGDGNPVSDVLVSLFGTGKILDRGFTDETGELSLFSDEPVPDVLVLTVSKGGFVPVQKEIATSGSPYITVDFTDPSPFPGDTVETEFFITNISPFWLSQCRALVRGTENLFVLDGVDTVLSLRPFEAAVETVRFVVSPSTGDREPAALFFDFADTSGFHQTVPCGFIVGKEMLSVAGYRVVSGELTSGGTATVEFDITNTGTITASGYELDIISSDTALSIPFGGVSLPDILPGDTFLVSDVPVSVSAAVLEPYFARVEFQFSGRFSSIDAIPLTIGSIDYFCDFEGTDGGFSSDDPLWGVVSTLSHSGGYSLWYGVDGHYPNGANSAVSSPPLVAGYNTLFSFWLYTETATYGTDGIYVYLEHPLGDTVQLDYIGSGGALDSAFSFINDWAEYSYDIGFIPPGDTFRIIFVVASDSEDYAEGFYIDDISVVSSSSGAHLGANNSFAPPSGFEITVFPIPFNLALGICYRKGEGEGEIEIFDILGKQVFSSPMECAAGSFSSVWNAGNLPSGVYFLRAEFCGSYKSRKVILLK